MSENNNYPFQEKYSDTNKSYEFANWNIPPRDKTEEWHIQNCEAIICNYYRNQSSLILKRQQDFNMLRLIAQGRQPTEYYMDILDPIDIKKGERQGLMNISWDILPIAPKYVAIVTGIFDKIEHNIVATAINEAATNERDEKKWRIWADKYLADFVADIDLMMGKEPKNKEGQFLPSSIEELNMYVEMGGIKLPQEITIEMLCDYTFYISQWREIKKAMDYDAFTIGFRACKSFVNPVTHKIELRYVDPEYLIVPYSKSNSFNDISRVGEITFWTVSQLRELKNEYGEQYFSEDELKEMAVNYSSYYNNSSVFNIHRADLKLENGSYVYDPCKIAVLDAEWFNDDVDVYVDYNNQYGAKKTIEKDFNYSQDIANREFSKKSNPKVSREKSRKVYKAKWVIGTKFIFEWGIANDQPFPPRLSYHLYKHSDRSILENMVSTLHDIQLSVLKFRNAKAMASPTGVIIDADAISNVAFGDKGIKPLEVLKIRRTTGDLIVSMKTHHSQNPNSGKPIYELEGGLGRQLVEFIDLMRFYLEQLADISGINSLVSAAEPKPGALVGVSQIAVNATNNALQTLYSGYMCVKENAAKSVCSLAQVLVNYKDIEGYYPVIGAAGMQVFKATSDLSNYEFGIKIELKPTEEDKQVIRNAALQSLGAGKQGGIGITMSDYMFIERMLSSGNLKYAQVYLAYQEAKREKSAQQLQRENMQLNQKGASDLEQMKQQMYELKKQVDTMSQIAIDNNKIQKQAAVDAQLAAVENKFATDERKQDANYNAVDKAIDNYFMPKPTPPSTPV